MRNKMIVLLITSLFIVVLTGCQKKKEEKRDEITVVTTYKPATDIVLTLTGKDLLVGTDDSSVSSIVLKGLNPKHEIKGIGSKKTGVNIEEIIALEPDVVVLYPTNERDTTKIQLETVGIEVITINPETVDTLKQAILTVGEAIGKKAVADDLITYMESIMRDINKRTENMTAKKKVYLAGAHGVLSTSSGQFYQHEIITVAGGIDVSKDLVGGWIDISSEQLINWNPDVIINVNYSPDTVTSILTNPVLSNLHAIKNDAVYEIPSQIESWDMPKPSSILAMLWLGKTIYPEAFSDINLLDEANDFYLQFYGKSFEDLGGVL